MSEQDDIAALVRSVRARVPMDAAQMLVKETPERIGMVFAELPQMLVERIQANLPLELQLQASESLAHREHRRPNDGPGAGRVSADDDRAGSDLLSAKSRDPSADHLSVCH